MAVRDHLNRHSVLLISPAQTPKADILYRDYLVIVTHAFYSNHEYLPDIIFLLIPGKPSARLASRVSIPVPAAHKLSAID